MKKEKKCEQTVEEIKDCKKFMKEISPLMKKLNGKNVLIRAILEEKITEEYLVFVENITPLIEKLKGNDKLVRAILNDKVSIK